MSFSGKNNCKITNRPSGGGNKLQGLPSSTALTTAANIACRNKSIKGNTNRNVIFKQNQLGGIGRFKSSFVSTADGISYNALLESINTLYYWFERIGLSKTKFFLIISKIDEDIVISKNIIELKSNNNLLIINNKYYIIPKNICKQINFINYNIHKILNKNSMCFFII